MKKNPQGTNNEGKEAGVQINDLEHKEEINNQLEQDEETRIQKNQGENKKTLVYLQKCQHPNRRCQKEKRKSKKLRTYFSQKIMRENLPNLAKEIDIQVQEAQSPKQVVPKEDHTKDTS